MKYFNITVFSKGKKRDILIEAENKQDAVRKAKLKTNGIVLKVVETSPPIEEKIKEFLHQIQTLRKKKVKRRYLISTIRQLAVMTNAGIPFHDALNEIANSTTDLHLRTILQDLAESINAGISFSKALEKYRYELGDLTITLIRLGEQTGDMAKALFTLANILENIEENVAKFKKAIRYPLITLTAMAIAFTILITYVVPKFKSIFEKLHAVLPLPTKILLWLEHALNTYGGYILLGFIASLATIIYVYRTNSSFKYTLDRYMLKVYLLKDIIYYSQLNLFMMIFSELIKAGIPIVDALDNSISMIGNSYIKSRLEMVRALVEKGSSIENAFKETQLFENMILQMINAGEASGQLDVMLEKITEYYGMKFNYLLDNMSSLIEPIMLALIAGMVLLLALGIFLPMWDLASAVRKAG